MFKMSTKAFNLNIFEEIIADIVYYNSQCNIIVSYI